MLQVIKNNLFKTGQAVEFRIRIIFEKCSYGKEISYEEEKLILKNKTKVKSIQPIKDGCIIYFKLNAKSYWENGDRHRINGPSIEFPLEPEKNRYFLHGIKYSKIDYETELASLKRLEKILENKNKDKI